MGLCSFLPFHNLVEEWVSDAKGDRAAISRNINNILDIHERDVPSTTNGIAANMEEDLANLSTSTSVFNTPVSLAHARDDEIVPCAPQGEGLCQTMKGLGFDVTWKRYESGGYWIQPEHGVDDMAGFMRGIWDC